MRKFLSIVLICISIQSVAQSYNNEWIDYSKTYYKFYVAQKGLHRINQAVLQNAGLASTPAQNFQLYRNGVQVPIYTSIATGALGVNDYIEFNGNNNDGAADADLYNLLSNQLSKKFSLINDTASYFLTTNTTTNQNIRLLPINNNVPTNTLIKDKNFNYTVGIYEKSMIHPGFASIVGEYLHASDYDKGEGWSSGEIYPGQPFNKTLTNLYPDLTATTNPSYTVAAAGNSLYPRTVKTNLNGVEISNPILDYFNITTTTTSFPLASLNAANIDLSILNTASNGNDRMVISFQEIKYPRLFNFNNQSYFEFDLDANTSGNYIEITNFNGGANPILYDLSNNKRYVPVVASGIYKFALTPSFINRKLVLVNEDNTNITNITSLQQKVFTNFLAASNQGDYLILASKYLHNSTASTNAIEKYKAYRSSILGGSFTTKIIDAEDLYDQYSFGIAMHPNAIRNYLRQARNLFTVAPKFVLIIGRGTSYNDARTYNDQPYMNILNQVPTFGFPASDNMLTAIPGTSIQTTPIGRIGAINALEVESYLNKIKEYEAKQADNNFTIDNKAWMKNGTFVAGSSEPYLQGIIDGYQTQYLSNWKEPFIGGATNLFTKTQAGGVVPLSNNFMNSLWATGHSVVEYFGHSSATTLEFNLDDPAAYSNQGKYPLMVINGCNAGNFFNYNPFRISTNNNQTLSEKFALAANSGSIGFVASTHFGVVNYLHYYNRYFFENLAGQDYGKPIGEIMKTSAQGMFTLTGSSDFYARMHAEQIGLNGDPAIKLNVSYPKPDYVIEDQTVKINPSFISIAESNFKANVTYMNLGKAIVDSININVKRQYPSGVTQTVFNRRVKAAYYLDSLNFIFNIDPLTDKGLNRIIIKVDGDDQISEMSEINNTITKDVFIFEDEARPIHPYNYEIVNALPLKLSASTANPFSSTKTYNMELDTTELFNSPSKITQTLSQVGGLLEFTPINTLINNTVYYWRVAVAGTVPVKWNTSSFTYINGSSFGSNQGHYFQHVKSEYKDLKLDNNNRSFVFDSTAQNITVRNGVWPTAAYEEGHLTVALNQDPFIRSFCAGDRIAVNVFSPVTGNAMVNSNSGGLGLFNSQPTCFSGRQWNFEYDYNTIVERNKLNDMLLNNVPNGSYVVLRNITFSWTDPSWLVNSWKLDAGLNGNGKSLYNTLKNIGFSQIDSFYTQRSWVYLYKKGVSSFVPKQKMSEGTVDRITLSSEITLPQPEGYITSPAFGPAKDWKEVHWRGTSLESTLGDTASVTIIGIRPNNIEDSITTLNATQIDFNIQNISATQYPYLKLKMKNRDAITATPLQLTYWRINFTPLPEGAIAPNITLQIKDSIDVGEPLQVKVAFKNVSYVAFDSLKVKMVVVDQAGFTHIYNLPKQKPLAVGEVLTVDYAIPTTSLSGINNLLVDINPDNDQVEEYHFNNFLFKNFYVRPDNLNPLLDVTFDNVHILNKDIVSANPNIVIKLKDESKFLALDNYNDLKIQLRFPGAAQNVYRTYNWNTDTLRFIPANIANGDNTATAELKPKDLIDGEYELIVRGKDKTGNNSGDLEYKVLFTVINKAMISNLLNYPNPFTSSTAFVFTITGKEVPQNIKIEVMTITGKIVREITKAELGPLKVGRNITDFKWDGTDQYGAKLANGVYLYRVVTNLNGKSLEKYKVGVDDKTDQYFNKGYGKMVLIR
jgi:hypothetical protein